MCRADATVVCMRRVHLASSQKLSQGTPASEGFSLLPVMVGPTPVDRLHATPGAGVSTTPHAPGRALPVPLPVPLPATGQTTARRSPPRGEPQQKLAKSSGRQKFILRENFAIMRAPGAEPAEGSSQTTPLGGRLPPDWESHLATNITHSPPTFWTHS
jgi:hypothetical protein